MKLLLFSQKYTHLFIGASLSEPHINVLNTSSVCLYVCMYSYVKYICIFWITVVVLSKIWKCMCSYLAME